MPLKDVGSYTLKHLQILDENGTLDKELEPELTDTQLLELYKWMALARAGDERQLKLQRQGRMGTFGPATGQEAAACGPTFAMEEEDWFVGSFRELGGRLMRGVKLSEEYLFWNGYEEGNVTPGAPRTLPNTVIVASQCLHAVGLAYAMKYRKEKSAVVCFMGDGATSQGDFHEALNFASVWELPVVFICQNNQWAISVPRTMQSKSETLAQKGLAYGMACIQVDGNDVLATYSATKNALDRAKRGGGPTFIEAVTFRLMMHTTADDPKKYRDAGVEEEWWAKDPLPRFRKYLEGKKVLTDALLAKMDEEIKAIVDTAVAELEEPTEFKVDAPFDHLYAEPHPHIEAQRREFLAMLEEEKAAQKAEEAAHA